MPEIQVMYGYTDASVLSLQVSVDTKHCGIAVARVDGGMVYKDVAEGLSTEWA
ncbi:MAG: hypothetical protein ACOYJK_01125 [Prevotella sp.]